MAFKQVKKRTTPFKGQYLILQEYDAETNTTDFYSTNSLFWYNFFNNK